MKNKKKYLAFMCSFYSIEHGVFHVQRKLVEKISNNFEKVYVINCQNLRFFPRYAMSVYMEKNYNIEKLDAVNMPKNFILFNPKSSKEFLEFLKDKDLLIMNHLNKHFFDLKVQRLIKKCKLKQIQVSNLGVETGHPVKTDSKHILKTLLYHFNQTFFKKVFVILTNLGIVPKLEIRFFSNLNHMEYIKKNKIKNFLYENKLLWAKEIKLVNSMAYDIFIENKNDITEDYIVHLDAGLNNRHELELRGRWPKEKVDEHYYYLVKFLKKLSKEFNKEVIVTIHPGYDINEHLPYLRDFKVLKYKTTEYIYKSFIVTAFNSSAVTDAILLKKKLLGLDSEFMSKNERDQNKIIPSRVGYSLLDIKKDCDFIKEDLLLEMNQNISNYQNYISKYHCFQANKCGSQEIVDIVKSRFF